MYISKSLKRRVEVICVKYLYNCLEAGNFSTLFKNVLVLPVLISMYSKGVLLSSVEEHTFLWTLVPLLHAFVAVFSFLLAFYTFFVPTCCP